ncbi:unnamed protein product [Ilex paraguariensis]|uniref:Uncharacterized protein n=1 Tax=Ilex paraguariensis TaxID=185542 RepID=A0ABC8S5R1_9AQUA
MVETCQSLAEGWLKQVGTLLVDGRGRSERRQKATRRSSKDSECRSEHRWMTTRMSSEDGRGKSSEDDRSDAGDRRSDANFRHQRMAKTTQETD